MEERELRRNKGGTDNVIKGMMIIKDDGEGEMTVVSTLTDGLGGKKWWGFWLKAKVEG